MTKNYVLATECGGSKFITGVIAEDEPSILGRRRIAIDRDEPKDRFFKRLIAAMYESIEVSGIPQDQIVVSGVSSAGVWDHNKGVVWSPNVPWDDKSLPLGQIVKDEFGLPTYAENDVKAAVQAEALYGYGRGRDDIGVLGYLTISAGIGLGLFDTRYKRLIAGEDGIAPEVGHNIIVPGGLECGCGGRGHWEAYGSGRGVVNVTEALFSCDPNLGGIYRTVTDGDLLMIPDRDRWIRRYGIDGSFTAKEVYEAVRKGDPFALAVSNLVAYFNAIGFGHIINQHQPGALVVGGSPVLYNKELVLDPVVKLLQNPPRPNEFTLIPPEKYPEIVVTQLGDDVVIYGASAVAVYANPRNLVQ